MAAPIAKNFGAASDALAGQYLAKAEKGAFGPGGRKAAALFSTAEESLIVREDFVEALKAASEALALFRASGSSGDRAVVDTLRLIAHAHICKADTLRYPSVGDEEVEGGALEALDEAERILKNEIACFRKANNRFAVGAMLVTLAEVQFSRGGADAQEASLAATDARGVLNEFTEARLEASACLTIAGVHAERMQLQDATNAASTALALFEEVGDRCGQATSHHALAAAHFAAGMFQDGVASAQQALAIFRTTSQRSTAFTLYNLAAWYLMQGKPKEAMPFAQEALQIFQQQHDGTGWQTASLVLVVRAHVDGGAVPKGLELAKECLSQLEKQGDHRGKIMVHEALAGAHLRSDDLDEAMVAVQRGIQACQDLGDKRWEANLLQTESVIHTTSKDWDKAAKSIEGAQAIRRDLGATSDAASGCSALAGMHMAQKDFRSAIESAEEQRDLFRRFGERNKEALALLMVASVRAMGQDPGKAMSEAKEALAMMREVGDRSGEGAALMAIAELHFASGSMPEALDAALETQVIFKDLGDYRMMAKAASMNAKIKLREPSTASAGTKAASEAVAFARKARDETLEVEMLVFMSEAQAQIVMKQAAESVDALKVLAHGGDKVLKTAREALRLARKLKNQSLVASAIHMVGTAHLIAHRFDEAIKAADECMAIFGKLGDMPGEVAAKLLRAEVYMASGNAEKATALATEAGAAAKACDDPVGEQRASDLVQSLKRSSKRNDDESSDEEDDESDDDGDEGAEAAVQRGPSASEVHAMVMETVSNAIGGGGSVVMDEPLMDMGLDSLSSVSFRNDLQKAAGFRIPSTITFDYPTPKAIVDYLVEQGASAAPASAPKLALKKKKEKKEKKSKKVAKTPKSKEAVAKAPAEPQGLSPAMVQDMVMNTVRSSVGADDITMDSLLMDAGLDSLSSVSFRNELKQAVGFNLPAALVFDYPSARALCDFIVEKSKDQ